MAQELVWATVGGENRRVGRAYAETHDLTVHEDEPIALRDGSRRRPSRANGRRAKKKTTVSTEAAKKAGKSATTDATPPSEEN